VFVKVCGITCVADAVAAVAAGVDAVGLNFVSSSRRCVDEATARAILAVVPDDVMTVGVFRDHAADDVIRIGRTLGLDAAQLHGDEAPECTAAVAAAGTIVIKVVAAGSEAMRAAEQHAADIVMLDGPVPGGGVPFDWDLVGDLATNHRVLLAGGLRPDNVAATIRRVRPWGVDVASGVEAAPGRKDADAMTRFVAAARSAAD